MRTIPIHYWIAFLAAIFQIAGYLEYLVQSRRDGARPNVAAWGMWTFGAATHLWAYSQVTEGWVQDFLPAVCSATCLIVFLVLWVRGKFIRGKREAISLWEKIVFWGDVGIASLFGTNLISAPLAAVALQLDDLLTYLPTLKDVAKNPQCEHAAPWKFWSLAFVLQGFVVASEGGGWVEWSYPLINLPLCMAVVFLADRKKTQDPV